MEKTIFIVGIGPGRPEFLTCQARATLEACDAIVGYTLYVALIKDSYPDKDFHTTGMRREIERCRLCFKLAEQGRKVALICSGDAGVYGLASPMHELLGEYPGIELIVVPGVTAANSGAAILGAPLNHDYCVVSLSDLMTPRTTIERRLRAAIDGDFAMAIYNPSSRRRADYLQRACDVMLDAGASPNRACGYVENIGRNDTRTWVGTLAELREESVNMFTTVFIGASTTYIQGNKLVTKRGYHE
ncbi:MAG: precorrin-3B C(17)-methyltransferase [Thermoguttaceae bacterium]|jgi:precorrin-3B C17-methyltransferase